jgi:hypothetical protein
MLSSRKGRGKIARPVPIPAGLAARLWAIAANRLANTPLLWKLSGEPWKKSDHARPFAQTAIGAGLYPNEITMNALRHSSIVRQLLAGVPVRVVAVDHETSVVMIERAYSRHMGDHADALARVALLDISVGPGGDVALAAAT